MKMFAPLYSRLTHWLKDRSEGEHIFQWINYSMIFTVLVLFIIEKPTGGTDWKFYTVVLALSAVLVLNIMWFQYHELLRASGRMELYCRLFMGVTDVLVLGTFALTGREEVVFLVLMQVAMFSSFFGTWPWGSLHAAISFVITMAIIKGLGASDADLLQSGSQILVGMLFVQVFVRLIDRARQETIRAENLLQDLRNANLQLTAAHRREKELAIAEERMRLARDIHDGLGHHLTVLSIQLQAAEKLVERSPQEAAKAIRISRSEAQAALDEVRQSVGVMRQSPAESQPLDEVLGSLVREFGQHTALQADFRQTGQPVELAPFARETLFRVVQEALTNAQKHGQGVTAITVCLEYTPEAVGLTILDNGHKPDLTAVPHPGGFGLTGLRERLEQLGGSLRSGAGRESGFELSAHIPLQEAGHDRRPAG